MLIFGGVAWQKIRFLSGQVLSKFFVREAKVFVWQWYLGSVGEKFPSMQKYGKFLSHE